MRGTRYLVPGTGYQYLECMRYRDRADAGDKLAAALQEAGYETDDRRLILGVVRGGVPVAARIAHVLGGTLDVAVARKIGAPGNPEFAIGAVAAGGEPVLNRDIIDAYQIPPDYVEEATRKARDEVERRTVLYREGRSAPDPAGRRVLVVDDGVATGSTLVAVLRSVRAAGAGMVVCAVPVGPPDTIARLGSEADDVVCPLRPRAFLAVGGWYEDFAQVTDEEVVALLGG